MKLKLATAFSGIGAVEQALVRLDQNFDIVFACDNGDIECGFACEDEFARVKQLKTYQQKNQYVRNLYSKYSTKKNYVEISYLNNYKLDTNRFFYDVRLLDGNDFKDQVDLFVGGSPCQSFSIAGQRGGFDDTRGTLFYEYARLVKEIQPKIFIYENVYGVINHDKGKTWAIMQNVFGELGYYFKWCVLNAKDYGIPQSRKRVFVVGFKDKKQYENFEFPKPQKLCFTMHDFLLDNCKEGNFISEKSKIVLLPGGEKVNRKLSQKLVNYVMSPGTKNFYHENARIDLPIAHAILSTQGNTHRASVNNYVTTDNGIRALEPRESLRLMGFPDTFNICVSRAQSYKQSGNSIVVDVLIALIKEIKKVF